MSTAKIIGLCKDVFLPFIMKLDAKRLKDIQVNINWAPPDGTASRFYNCCFFHSIKNWSKQNNRGTHLSDQFLWNHPVVDIACIYCQCFAFPAAAAAKKMKNLKHYINILYFRYTVQGRLSWNQKCGCQHWKDCIF